MAILRQLGSRREARALGRDIPESRASNPARQFKYRNLRSGAEPDGETGDPDAAVDVELRSALFVPSVGVAIKEMAEVETAVDEVERQLPTMSVSGQRQVDAEVGGAIEHQNGRLMCQQKVDGALHHQPLVQAPVDITFPFCFTLASRAVYPDQIKLFAAQLNRLALLPQDADALRGE